ncbi:solute carrier family 12 member 8-like, partial [Tropilaelaps mercedesae]
IYIYIYILRVFQAVNCALHLMAFAESLCVLLKFEDAYIEKAIAVVVLMFLLGVSLAGVKWVVRIQFVLLVFLLAALSDFGVGIFTKKDMANGVTGFNGTTLVENWRPSYMPEQNWFTIFGVFFPAMTGVYAGINMSSDLLQPAKNIPAGTFSAIGTSVLIYIAMILGLGATSQRWALQQNYIIAEKVSAIGVLFLSGLYISSTSASLGSLYATPRILQRMAIDGILPGSHYLAEGFEQVCVIRRMSSRPWYVSLQKERREKHNQRLAIPSNRQYAAEVATPMTGSPTHHYGPSATEPSATGDTASTGSGAGDLERLFPECVTVMRTRSRASSSTSSPITSPGHSSLRSTYDKASALISQETK